MGTLESDEVIRTRRCYYFYCHLYSPGRTDADARYRAELLFTCTSRTDIRVKRTGCARKQKCHLKVSIPIALPFMVSSPLGV